MSYVFIWKVYTRTMQLNLILLIFPVILNKKIQHFQKKHLFKDQRLALILFTYSTDKGDSIEYKLMINARSTQSFTFSSM